MGEKNKMAILKKELTLYERDEKGAMLAQEVGLVLTKEDEKDYPDLKGAKIKITPLTRGELKKMFGLDGGDVDANADNDNIVLVEHCKEPSFTEEEVKFAKPHLVRIIVKTILKESGVKIDEDTGTRSVDEDADEFGKNS